MRSHTHGFTLVETVVVTGLTALLLLALTFLIQFFYKTNAYTLEQSQAINSARRSVENAMSDVRGASYGADGSYPIAAAATSSITFFTHLAPSTSIDKVRYYQAGATLYRAVTIAAGSPPTYAGQPETTTLVVDNIRNDVSTPLFSYFDAQGQELVPPVDVGKIASVSITVLTDVNPLRAPNVYTLVGSATIRNLHNLLP